MKQADYKYMEERPWGKFYVIQETNNYKIKRIEVNSTQRLELRSLAGEPRIFALVTRFYMPRWQPHFHGIIAPYKRGIIHAYKRQG